MLPAIRASLLNGARKDDRTLTPHLPYISPVSPLHLPIYLGRRAQGLYLPHISPIPPPHLAPPPCVSPGTRKDGSDADLRFDLPPNFQGQG